MENLVKLLNNFVRFINLRVMLVDQILFLSMTAAPTPATATGTTAHNHRKTKTENKKVQINCVHWIIPCFIAFRHPILLILIPY